MRVLLGVRTGDAGWSLLGGSDEQGRTWLCADGDDRFVVKRFAPETFPQARLTASVCSGGLFHRVLAEDEAASLLVFEHVPGRTLASELDLRSDHDARLELARRYVDHIKAATDHLRFLDRPRPAGELSLSPLLGLPRPTSTSRHVDSVSRVMVALDAVLTGDRPVGGRPVPLEKADQALTDMIDRTLGAARRWIVSDTNPANVIVGPTGALTTVDVQLTLGVPETALVPVGGPVFGLAEDVADALVLEHEEFAADRWHIVNAYFALCSTLDTLSGLANGSRNGLAAVSLTLSDVVAQSVDSAGRRFARIQAGQAYLPALRELGRLLDRSDVRSRLSCLASTGRAGG